MGKQNKNIFDCQGGDFSLKSLDDSFDAEDGEWYPDNSDETNLVLAASLCKNNAVKKEKKKKKGKKKEKQHDKIIDIKTRRIITVVALISSGITDNSLRYHLENAKKNDVTKEGGGQTLVVTAGFGWY